MDEKTREILRKLLKTDAIQDLTADEIGHLQTQAGKAEAKGPVSDKMPLWGHILENIMRFPPLFQEMDFDEDLGPILTAATGQHNWHDSLVDRFLVPMTRHQLRRGIAVGLDHADSHTRFMAIQLAALADFHEFIPNLENALAEEDRSSTAALMGLLILGYEDMEKAFESILDKTDTKVKVSRLFFHGRMEPEKIPENFKGRLCEDYSADELALFPHLLCLPGLPNKRLQIMLEILGPSWHKPSQPSSFDPIFLQKDQQMLAHLIDRADDGNYPPLLATAALRHKASWAAPLLRAHIPDYGDVCDALIRAVIHILDGQLADQLREDLDHEEETTLMGALLAAFIHPELQAEVRLLTVS